MEQFCAELEQLLADLSAMKVQGRRANFANEYIELMIMFIKTNCRIPDILRNRPNELLYISYDELKNKILDNDSNGCEYYLSCRYFTIIDQCDIKIALKN